MEQNNWLRKTLQELPLSDRVDLLNDWLTNLNQKLNWDIRGEVLAANLIKNGIIDIENLLLAPQSTFKRTFRKDVASLHCIEKESLKKEMIEMPLNREGLYDALPEALFHFTGQSASVDKSVREMCEESVVLRQEEKDARTFFLPFEHAIYGLRIYLEQQANNMLTNMANFEELKEFWGILPEFNQRQSLLLMYLLPIVHRINHNLALVANCFSSILGKDVELQYGKCSVQAINEEQTFFSLGNTILGKNTLLMGLINEGIPSMEVHIKYVGASELVSYLEGGVNFKILEFLYAYFLPVEADITTDIYVQKKEQQFHLLPTVANENARLGFTTSI